MSTLFQKETPEAHDVVSETPEIVGPDSFPGNEFDPSPAPAALIEDIPDDVSEAQFVKPDDANVILSASRADEALAEGLTNIGTFPVTLPSKGQQSVGFHVDPTIAGILITQFGQYKFLVDKGQATPPVTTGD